MKSTRTRPLPPDSCVSITFLGHVTGFWQLLSSREKQNWQKATINLECLQSYSCKVVNPVLSFSQDITAQFATVCKHQARVLRRIAMETFCNKMCQLFEIIYAVTQKCAPVCNGQREWTIQQTWKVIWHFNAEYCFNLLWGHVIGLRLKMSFSHDG
jgi:hypothetical protein